MSETTQGPTHFRLMSKLKAIGPYLREPQSQEGHYYFDCLSVCVDDKKSPEKREFWGWWMDLESIEGGFTAKYHIGKYNKEGGLDFRTTTRQGDGRSVPDAEYLPPEADRHSS